MTTRVPRMECLPSKTERATCTLTLGQKKEPATSAGSRGLAEPHEHSTLSAAGEGGGSVTPSPRRERPRTPTAPLAYLQQRLVVGFFPRCVHFLVRSTMCRAESAKPRMPTQPTRAPKLPLPSPVPLRSSLRSSLAYRELFRDGVIDYRGIQDGTTRVTWCLLGCMETGTAPHWSLPCLSDSTASRTTARGCTGLAPTPPELGLRAQ